MARTKQSVSNNPHRSAAAIALRSGKGSLTAVAASKSAEPPKPKHNPKPKRHRPSQVVLSQIRKYQKSTDLLIPRLPFQRLVKDIFQGLFLKQYRIQASALEALQEVAEAYLVSTFEMSQICAYHGSRLTVYKKDMQLVRRLRGETLSDNTALFPPNRNQSVSSES